MPYLTQEDKNRLAEPGAKPEKSGELNYLLTLEYIDAYERKSMSGIESRLWNIVWDFLSTKELRYDVINTVIGAIDCSLLEFFFRVCPTVAEDDEEGKEFIYGMDERITEWKVTVYDKVAVPYEKQKIKENGDVYRL